MVKKASNTSLFLLISFLVSMTLFFVLIAFMRFVPPVIAIDHGITVEFVEKNSNEIEIAPPQITPDQKEYKGADSISDLFGSDDKPQEVVDSTEVSQKIDIKKSQNIQTRTNSENRNIEPITTRSEAVQQIRSTGEMENAYYQIVMSKLNAYWQPQAGDQNKQAIIEMRINRDGRVEYKIINSPDQLFLDRLKIALDRLQREGLPPPEKSLKLKIHFKVKE